MLHNNRFCRSVRPGTWRPATLIRSDVILLKVLLVVFAAVRAVDYGTSGHLFEPHVAGVEAAVPPCVWAILCAAVAALLGGGIALKSHGLVWAGHFLGAVVYVALAVGAVQYSLAVEPPDEWRRAGPLFVVAYVHAMFAIRSGPEPLGHGPRDEKTVERAVGPRE